MCLPAYARTQILSTCERLARLENASKMLRAMLQVLEAEKVRGRC